MYTNYTKLQSNSNTLCKGNKCNDLYKELLVYYETDDNLSDDIIDLKYKLLRQIASTKC